MPNLPAFKKSWKLISLQDKGTWEVYQQLNSCFQTLLRTLHLLLKSRKKRLTIVNQVVLGKTMEFPKGRVVLSSLLFCLRRVSQLNDKKRAQNGFQKNPFFCAIFWNSDSLFEKAKGLKIRPIFRRFFKKYAGFFSWEKFQEKSPVLKNILKDSVLQTTFLSWISIELFNFFGNTFSSCQCPCHLVKVSQKYVDDQGLVL